MSTNRESQRDNILARIRQALTRPAAVPGRHQSSPGQLPIVEAPGAPSQMRDSLGDWLPAVGDSFDDRTALFAKNSAELQTDFRIVHSQSELDQQLKELAADWKKVSTHAGELTDAATAQLGLPICTTQGAYEKEELEACDAGISQCDALIAQTGSVLVTSRSAGGRALSVLPPHHVVLARGEQLLPDLPSAFALLAERYGDDYPSFMSLITGPSRTGDIERILVLGAHGPKRLTVFCLVSE